MNGMQIVWRLTKSENKKIFGQRKYKFFLIFFLLVVLGGAVLNTIPGNTLHFTMSNYPYTVLSMISYIFAPLAIFMLTADLFSGEIDNNQMKVMLTRPVSRCKILLAKIAAIFLYAGIILLSGFIVSGLLSVFTAGVASFSLLTVLGAYATNFIPFITTTAMAALIGVYTKTSTSCFSFCLTFYLGIMLLGLMFSGLVPILFTSYMGIGSMVIGTVIPMGNLFLGIAILLGYAVLFLSAGSLKFEKMEF